MELREALTTGETTIIDNTILKTVINPTRPAFVLAPHARMRLGPADIKGSSLTIPIRNKDAMLVSEIAEGTAYPHSVADYTDITVTPKKYGMRPNITREMQEDGMIAVITDQLEEAGFQMAKRLERLIVAELDAAATAAGGNNDQTSQTALTFTNMTLAQKALEDNDFVPLKMYVSPAGAQDIRLLDTFTEAQKYGSNEMQMTGFIGTILGMDVLRSTLATDTDSGVLAYIFDPMYSYIIGEKRPINVVKYDDEAADMTNLAISARWDVQYINSGAVAVITST